MSNAVVVHEVGGPEKLSFEPVPDAAPGPGEARVRHTAVGLNFIDVYFRTGLYKAPSLPFIPVRSTSYRVVPSPCVRRLRYSAARSALSVSSAPPSP